MIPIVSAFEPRSRAAQTIAETNCARALQLLQGNGFPTARVEQLLLNESDWPVILFTVVLPNARRGAATAWLDGPLNDPGVGLLVTAGWDVA